MNVFKKKFPSKESLEQRLNETWFDINTQIRSQVGYLEDSYVKAVRKRNLLFSILTVIFIFGLGFTEIIFVQYAHLIIFGVIVLIIFLVSKFFRVYLETMKIITDFNQKLNQVVFSETFSLFGITGEYRSTQFLADEKIEISKVGLSELFNKFKKAQENKQQIELASGLDASELITEPRNTMNLDDMFKASVNDKELLVGEMDIRHVTGSGKNRSEKKIFKGYFVRLELGKKLEGKTFVSTEGDKRGFGHRSFWKDLNNKGAQETELEWNDFEDLLHVASTNPVEARYILTPEFMNDLYDWWNGRKINIRFSFIGEYMYMLFPNDNIKLGKTVKNLDRYELQTYIMTIAEPLRHVLHIVEDVQERFR